jgi:hypothetical protein
MINLYGTYVNSQVYISDRYLLPISGVPDPVYKKIPQIILQDIWWIPI